MTWAAGVGAPVVVGPGLTPMSSYAIETRFPGAAAGSMAVARLQASNSEPLAIAAFPTIWTVTLPNGQAADQGQCGGLVGQTALVSAAQSFSSGA